MFDFGGGGLEDFDEETADCFAFGFRVFDAGEGGEELGGGIDEVYFEVFGLGFVDGGGFPARVSVDGEERGGG